jgi:hypothetical protein
LRAAIWRDLKKFGAVYLRDGVCALPARDETVAAFRAIEAKILSFGGQATLALDARLEPARGEAIIAQARQARSEEYAEIGRDAEGFLAHVERERSHRVFTYAELEELEADLGKLQRWLDQVRARDHFAADGAAEAAEAIARGEATLAAFADAAFEHDPDRRPPEVQETGG